MNMMDGPKFRRKHTSATGDRRPLAKAPDHVPPSDETSEQARLAAKARVRAEEEAQQEAEQRARARRKAEFEEIARAEALRRVIAARDSRQAGERDKAEQAERAAAAAEREAQERAEREGRERAEREAQERAEREAREQAEREAQERAEREAREQAEREAQERAEREAREQAEREAQERAEREAREQAEREAQERAEREAREQAEREAQERAEREAAGLEARTRRAEPASPLPLTEMIAPGAPALQGAGGVDAAWRELSEVTIDEKHLDRNRIISASRRDPAHAAFDVLRTRLLQTLAEKGWRRVAITSPGENCGKTFTAANLAISLSRQENCRTLLMDLDLRRPGLHSVLGIKQPGAIGDLLRGTVAPREHLRRMGRNKINAGRNIAFALNDRVEAYPAELLQDPRTRDTLRTIEADYAPDVILFDLPPALFHDDVIAFRPHFDGMLLVIGGGLTTEREIRDVENRLGEKTPLLGMVLNKAEGAELRGYNY